MNIYSVVRKSDNKLVHTYQSDVPVEWDQYSFTEYDHIPEAVVPVDGPQYVGSWKITRLAFRNRFTTAEKASMELASLDNTQANLSQRQQAAVLRAYMSDVTASTFIDLNRPDTRAGVQQLENLGLLAAGRAHTILNTVPLETELFNG